EISKELEKNFKKQGIEIMTSSEVTSVDTSGNGVKAKVKTPNGEVTLEADVLLSAVGISSNIEGIGLEELGIKTDKGKILVDKFPLSASGKATAAGHMEGFIKVIFDAKYGEWLGTHMIGYNVTEIISETVTARKLETTYQEVLNSIHPHPTISESVKDAIEVAYGEAIHL